MEDTYITKFPGETKKDRGQKEEGVKDKMFLSVARQMQGEGEG